MITKTKQIWEIGETVKVGFIPLTVIDFKRTPKDFKPDAYLLQYKDNYYSFVPHNGLTKLANKEAFHDRLQ